MRTMNTISRYGRRGAQRSAFTLIECVVYMGVVFLIIGLAFMAFYHVEENHRHLAQNADDILRTVRAGERWREDIRRATGPILVTLSNAQTELTIPHTNGVVRYSLRQGGVWRQTGSKPLETLAGVIASKMERESRSGVTAWRWDVELKTRQKVARVRPLFTFFAVSPKDKENAP